MALAKSQTPPALLNITAMARHLGITTETLRSWEATYADFPRRRLVGRRPYYLLAEVEEWLRNQPEWKGGHSDAENTK